MTALHIFARSALLCIALAASSLAASTPTALQPLFRSEPTVVRHLPQLDPAVRQMLLRQFRDDRRIADYGAEFDPGCTGGTGALPSRRFALAVHIGDRWFVEYEHGGIGRHSHLVVFSRSGTSWRVAYNGSGFYEYYTLPKLRRAITRGEYHKQAVDA